MESLEALDYSGKRLDFGNIYGKCYEINNRVALSNTISFNLNISNNRLDDGCIETLLSLLSNETMDHLAIIDLKKNYVTRRGLLMLAPILIRDYFKWLVATDNYFDLNDYGSFFSDLRTLSIREAVKMGRDWEALLNYWISKVIFVPESFIENIDLLPIAPSSKNSHRMYYKKLRFIDENIS